MKIVFKESFNKDILRLTDNNLKNLVYDAILNIENATKPNDIKNIGKLKGFKTAFKIKIKNYRIGLIIINDIVFLSRFAHRKDIYNIFP